MRPSRKRLRRIPEASLLAVAWGLLACPQDIEVGAEDAGGTAVVDTGARFDLGVSGDVGAPTDGGADAAVEGDLGPSDGGEADGGVGMDAGSSASTAPLQFRRLNAVLAGAPSAIHGVAPGIAWVGTQNGNLYLVNDGVVSERLWHEPSNFSISAIDHVGNRIYVASTGALHVFDGLIQPTFSRTITVNRRDIYGLAAMDLDAVYMVGHGSQGAFVATWDGSRVVESSITSVAGLYGVTKAGSEALLAGHGTILSDDGTGLLEECITEPPLVTLSNVAFEGFARYGAGFLVYGSAHWVAEKTPNGCWEVLMTPSADEEAFRAGFGLGTLATKEAWLVSLDGKVRRVLDGRVESHDLPTAARIRVYAGDSAGPNQAYLGGVVPGGSGEPALLRGTR